MIHRFRHLDEIKVVGLYLHMQALLSGKTSVRLSNRCLCRLTGQKALHDHHLKKLAQAFHPYMHGVKILNYVGKAKTARFFLPGQHEGNDDLSLSSLPPLADMENALGFVIRTVEMEKQSFDIVTKSNFSLFRDNL